MFLSPPRPYSHSRQSTTDVSTRMLCHSDLRPAAAATAATAAATAATAAGRRSRSLRFSFKA